ncbi:Maintenance of ploidy protein mob2 [Tieghemiomyces parasiticus]|uniref:Maintenance of ploidy protein mob2 n=1 Tax=Tieghemiomyces parasiticus TaxID=78921 RepID=A0A9W8DMR5_9FUNG|nr:Maintenance of ploidy protein mob2 [Tieghemiomyces parasiticus]
MSFFNLPKFGKKSKRTSTGSDSHHIFHLPGKSHPEAAEHPPLFLLPSLANSALLKGRIRPLVERPKYVDPNEWLASQVFDFFEYINLFYGALSEFCTLSECPCMSAGPSHEYTWTDNSLRNAKLPAPQYIDYVMTWIQNLLDDEAVFPTKAGNEFPRGFPSVVRAIVKQIFRVFAHIFYSHYDKLLHLTAERHFNSLFSHFMTFCREFDLLDKKEVAPMADLIQLWEANGVFA